MFGIVSAAGLGLLHARYCLVTQHIWIGAVHAAGLGATVKIDHQMMPRRGLGSAVIKCDAFLIIALDKVNFHASDAPFLVPWKGLRHLFRGFPVTEPNPNSYAFGAGITHQLGNINAAIHLRDVTAPEPTGIDQ